MFKSGNVLSSALAAVLLTGCAPAGLYYWGGYEDSLYDRYVEENAGAAETYSNETIIAAEQRHRRVPPGIYADYGFLLYKRGEKQAAIAYFEKEMQTYPESSALMTKLIGRVRQQMGGEDNSKKDSPHRGESK